MKAEKKSIWKRFVRYSTPPPTLIVAPIRRGKGVAYEIPEKKSIWKRIIRFIITFPNRYRKKLIWKRFVRYTTFQDSYRTNNKR